MLVNFFVILKCLCFNLDFWINVSEELRFKINGNSEEFQNAKDKKRTKDPLMQNKFY